MDEQERNKYGLPADYVTIHMLRERWLQKQEQENLKEKQEQEALAEAQNLEKDCKNHLNGELEVCNRFENDGPRERVGKDGGEIARIEEKEKIGWSGNGREANRRNRGKGRNHGVEWKKKNGDTFKVKVEDTEKRQNPRPKEGIDLVGKKNWTKGVEINIKNKIAGFASGESSGTVRIGEIVSVGVADVLPKSAVSEGGSAILTSSNVSKDGLRGGFQRNENDRDEGFSGNNSLGKKVQDEVLEIDRKRRKWRNRKGKGGKFKQSGGEMSGLKLSEVELKPEVEKSGIVNEGGRMKGLHSGTGRIDIKQKGVDEVELKPEDEKSEIWNEGGHMKGLYCGSGRDDIKQNGVNEVELKLEEKKSEIGNEGGRMKGLHSGTGRNDIKQNGLDEVELKPEDEKLEIGHEGDHIKGVHSGTGRNAKQNGVDGEALATDILVLGNIMEETVLAEKSRNDGFRGYGNRRRHLKEKNENLTVGNRKESYLGSKVERKFGGNRHSGRFRAYRNMKQRECGMVWVKKELSGAVDGEASSMGVEPD